MRSLRWSCRRSFDSLSSRSTVSDSLLLWSSFIFSRWRTCTQSYPAAGPGHWSLHPTLVLPVCLAPALPTTCSSPSAPGSLARVFCPPASSLPCPQTIPGGWAGWEGPHPCQLLVLLLQLALQLSQVLLDVAMPFLGLGTVTGQWQSSLGPGSRGSGRLQVPPPEPQSCHGSTEALGPDA